MALKKTPALSTRSLPRKPTSGLSAKVLREACSDMPSVFCVSERVRVAHCFSVPFRGNKERQRLGDQRGLVRSFDLQRVPRLHDRLPALLWLDAGENDAQAHARAGGHGREEARLVDPIVEAGGCVLRDDADLHAREARPWRASDSRARPGRRTGFRAWPVRHRRGSTDGRRCRRRTCRCETGRS